MDRLHLLRDQSRFDGRLTIHRARNRGSVGRFSHQLIPEGALLEFDPTRMCELLMGLPAGCARRG
jgi:hypothetical protein